MSAVLRNYRNGKANRTDHRKAVAEPSVSVRRRRKIDSKNFKTVEQVNDPSDRFARSIKAVYYDNDGDGYDDSYGRVFRSGAAGKPGAIIPTFGPIIPPVSGPSDLTADEVFLAPASGPSNLDATIIVPNAGPSDLDTEVLAPVAGPSDLDTAILAPAAGPSGLNVVEGAPDAPASGPSDLDASIAAPASGPSDLDTSIIAPASGPSGLDASIAAPASGPSDLDASIVAPASGPSGLSAEIATLNIQIVSDQSFADSAGSIDGEIKYSSDAQHLFIYDSAEGVWHRTDGGNS